MRVAFAKKKLERLYLEGIGAEQYPEAVYLSFVDAIRLLILAPDERTLYQIPGFRPEKLQGKRRFDKSIRLNKQFRLIYRIEQDPDGNFCFVLDLEDYH
jgi:toxin HigB-1